MGRPMIPITATQIRMVTEAYSKDPAGVVRIAKRLRQNYNISLSISHNEKERYDSLITSQSGYAMSVNIPMQCGTGMP